jgi:hypothetical protein
MSKPRSRIRGPRFALTSPETCRACIKCVYGNGEHAAWCLKQDSNPLHPFKIGDPCEVRYEDKWYDGIVTEVWPGGEGYITAHTHQFGEVALLSLKRGLIRTPQRAHAGPPQPVETVPESANA